MMAISAGLILLLLIGVVLAIGFAVGILVATVLYRSRRSDSLEPTQSFDVEPSENAYQPSRVQHGGRRAGPSAQTVVFTAAVLTLGGMVLVVACGMFFWFMSRI